MHDFTSLVVRCGRMADTHRRGTRLIVVVVLVVCLCVGVLVAAGLGVYFAVTAGDYHDPQKVWSSIPPSLTFLLSCYQTHP